MKYQITTLAAAGGAALGLACATAGPNIEAAPAAAVYASRIVPVKGPDITPGDDAMEVQLPHVVTWTNANIFAHLAEGDSLEIQLSRQGASRAQDQAVRDFANRMVSEHSAHLQTGQQLASRAGIALARAPDDTADAAMAARVFNRLSNLNTNNAVANGGNNGANANANNANAGTRDTYDRRFMRAEVMMHQHMLSDLATLRSQASGAAAELIDHTIPVVQQHLGAAQKVWQQVGGVLDNNRAGKTTRGQ